jgi:multiple sugar transport system ATP-binding protein
VIEVDGLTKSFAASGESVAAVAGIDFSIKAGAMATLLGPSGCGKTTTLRCLAGLERPEQGRIAIGGETMVDMARGRFVPPQRRNLGMVFQSYAIWPHMTVLENVAYALEGRGLGKAERTKRAMEALALVRLADLAERPAPRLSGGQQQRVAIARAMVGRPQALLFDEPLSNLDAQLRDKMRSEIKRLHQELAATMIYVTHDQIEAMTLADRIVLMNSGQVEQVGAPLELYDRPATQFVAGFLGSPKINLVPGRLVANGSRLNFEAGDGTNLVLPSHMAAAAHSYSDRPVTLAIRPQHVTEALGSAGPDDVRLRTSIELVQPTGSRTYVTARLADSRIVAEADAHAVLRPGAAIDLAFDMRHAILIDPENGRVFACGIAG